MIFVHLPYFFEGGICMSEFRVFKNGDFTVMSNYHLKDKELSLKATGLLSKMLSLPDDWDYSLAGLVALTKDGQDSVKSTLNELKARNYVEIVKYRTKKGTFQYNYLIFENPSIKALKMRKRGIFHHWLNQRWKNQRWRNPCNIILKNLILKNLILIIKI